MCSKTKILSYLLGLISAAAILLAVFFINETSNLPISRYALPVPLPKWNAIDISGKLLKELPKELPKAYVVYSGSMEPAIKVGSVVLSIPQNSYNSGDIITFRAGDPSRPEGVLRQAQDDSVVTHRVEFKLYPAGVDGKPIYLTSGDANEDFDQGQVTDDQILGKVALAIPYLGYVADFAKKPYGFILLVIVPATIIIYEESKFIKQELARFISRFKKRSFLRKRGIVIKKEEVTEKVIRFSNKDKSGVPKASILIPVIGAALVLVSLSVAYFFDLEISTGNILGAAESFEGP